MSAATRLWLDAHDSILQKAAAEPFNHLLGGEADRGRVVGAAQHAWPHAGVIVVRRGTDDGQAVALGQDVGNVGQGRQMGVTAAGKDKMRHYSVTLHLP